MPVTPIPMRFNPGSQEILRGTSPDPVPRLTMWHSGALSPDVPSRAMSPDGLGEGIFSSVFIDTGVEGLIYESGSTDIRDRRHIAPSPRQPEVLGATDSEEATPQMVAIGNGAYEERGRTRTVNDVSDATSPPSPPTSPRRRETTFGATLDFVEALCTASSNLTAFQRKQWSLLHLHAWHHLVCIHCFTIF